MKKILSLALSLLIVFSSMSCISVSVSAADACEHSYGSWVTDVSATCTKEGSRHHECVLCGYVESEVVAKSSHSVSTWTTTTAATCTATGSKYGTCSNCSQKITQTISATGHSVSSWTTTVAATCTEAGSKYGTCSDCSASITQEIAALGHSFSEMKYSEMVDGSTEGERTKVCSRCSYIWQENLSYTPIYTIDDLRNIDNNLSGAYLLMNDIDLTEATAENGEYNHNGLGWRPIGAFWEDRIEYYSKFTGVFNGNGHTIKGMQISFDDSIESAPNYLYLGLFANIGDDGAIFNLRISDIDIDCNNNNITYAYVGGIAGVGDGVFEYCSVGGTINVTGGVKEIDVGGLCGRNIGGNSLKYCDNSADITCEVYSNKAYVGGLVGYTKSYSDSINSCWNAGDVKVSGSATTYAGGVFGYLGGLALLGVCSVENLYNTGEINGLSNKYTSGLIGQHYKFFGTPKVITSYNIGKVRYGVDEAYNPEGYIGNALSSQSAEDSYYLEGTGDSNGIAMPEEAMKNQSNYYGFDFSNIWTMENSTYPVLRNSFCNKYGHGDGEWIVEKEATCREDGYEVKKCQFCGVVAEEKIVESDGMHNFGSLLFSVVPTTNTVGYATHTCFDCGFMEEVEVAPLSAEGTCGDSLYWMYSGSGILYVYGSGNMDDYASKDEVPWSAFNEEITTVLLDDTITGIGSYAFYGCPNIRSVTIAGLVQLMELPMSLEYIGANAFTQCEAFPDIDNTNEIIGKYINRVDRTHVKVFELSKDNYFEIRNTSGNCSSFYGNWIITKNATCSSYGSRYKECSKCGYRVTESISKTSHTVSSWTTTKAATCSATGTKTGTCSVCSSTVTETIAKTSHSVSSWTTDISATCTSTGSRHGTCSNCSVNVTETIAALGHSYGDEIPSILAEGETTGTYTQKCTRCSHTITNNIYYTPIYTAEDLRNIDNNLDGFYLLMNDIDLTEATSLGGEFDHEGHGWKPIGVEWSGSSYHVVAPFRGVLNGNGHTIKGMQIRFDEDDFIDSSTYYGGLIATTDMGVISSVCLSDVSISFNNSDVSSAYIGSFIADNNAALDYSNSNGKINVNTKTAILYVGGLVGNTTNDSRIKKSTSNIDIKVESEVSEVCVGGIVGYSKTKAGKIDSCSNFGSVEGYSNGAEANVGGIIGYCMGTTNLANPNPQNLFNAGEVRGSDSSYTGGIIGQQLKGIFNLSKVSYSYNTGLVQYSFDNGKTFNLGNAITNNKATSCYYLESSGDGVGTALSDAEMKTQSSFSGFDFYDDWKFGDYDYPILRNSFCERFGHKDSVWQTKIEATCGTEGKEIMLCPSCGMPKETRIIDATGEHKLGSLTITVAPTKDTSGEGYRECEDCGEKIYEIIGVADDSGSCGDNLTWAYDDGVLSIYGSGDMDSWTDATMVPWHSVREEIKEIFINKDVTSIGNFAFNGCINVAEFELPQAVTKIGAEALSNCSAFPNVDNPTTTYATYTNNNNKTHTKIFKLSDDTKDYIYVFDVCDFKSTVVEPTVEKYGYTEHKCKECGYTYETDIVNPIINDNCVVAPEGSTSLVLFNSGLNTTAGKCYGSQSSCKNPAWDTIDNQNYDIYGRMRVSGCSDRIRIGLGFYVSKPVIENAVLSINAYDVDEEGGEYDEVILVDETTGTQTIVGTLSGMNNQWNNTKISISPDKFTKGHVYHFEVQINDTRGSCTWWVYVRNVALQISTKGETATETFSDAALSATIDENGTVTADLSLATSSAMNLKVEYDAVCANYQYGSYFKDITSTTSLSKYTSLFGLVDGAPKGVYSITAYIKDANGNVLKTLTTNAGYTYYAVSYDSNGGTNIVPEDNTPYSIGKTVTVLFNNVPTREGYAFLGWSEDKNATEATYTADGKKTFVMKESDVVLYAVWSENVCVDHKFVATVKTPATCTEDGIMIHTCEVCGYSETQAIVAEHKYEVTDRVDATCTTEGYIEYTCSACGDVYRETLTSSHKYKAEITKVPKKGENGIITYTCTICGHTYTEEIVGDGSHILLVQDVVPWSVDNNPKLLNKLVDEGYIDGWSLTNTTDFVNVDLSEFEVVLIANDQTTATYNKLATFNNKLCEYAENGGTVVYGACDHGWKSGNISYSLPGGVVKGNYYSNANYIVDYTSHIVKGELTDNLELTNDKLYGTFCSHTYFDTKTLPEGSNIILVDGKGNPTLVEYAYGDGRIVASGLTWEFYFTRVYGNINPNFSKSVYDDLLVFALSNGWCVDCRHATQTEMKEATCTTSGYVRDVCSDCGVVVHEEIIPALGHDTTGGYNVIKKATCEEDGLKELYCARCNVLIADNIVIAASGHEFGDWTNEIEATCHNEGTRARYCIHTVATDEYEACDAHESKTVEKLTHEYSDVVATTDATCLEDGFGYRKCTLCGDVQNEVILAKGHDYSADWVIIKQATCTEKGAKAHVCTNCNLALDETEIEPLGHNYDAWEYIVTPTCTTDGERYTTCLECGEEFNEIVKTTGHKYSNEWTFDVPVTCLTDGEKSHHCLNCDAKTDTTLVKATGHIYGEWVDDVTATCLEDGEHHRTCVQCPAEEREVVPALGHNYSTAWTYDIEPTCTEDGEKSHHCTRCDEIIDVTVVAANGHSFGEWTVVTEATADANGSKERTCSVCSLKETEEIIYVDPTYAISGTVSYIVTTDKYGASNLYVGGKIEADISQIVSGDGGAFECTYQWNASGVPIEGATSKTYTVTEADLGKNISVTVTAVEPYSGSVTGANKLVYLDKVENVKAENTDEGVKITWDKHDYATEYKIYRSTLNNGLLATCKATTSDLEYIDTSANDESKTYYYYVVAINGSAKSLKSNVAKIKYVAIFPLYGQILDDGGIELTWEISMGSLPGLSINPTYHILGKTEGGEWVEIGCQKSPFVYYNNGENYEYFAVYGENDGYTSPLSNIVHLYGLKTPTVNATVKGCYVEVTWDSVPNAINYTIRRNGTYLTTLEGLTSYQDFAIDTGVEYTYAVCANDGKTNSAFGEAIVFADLMHEYDDEIVEIEPTCTESGSAYVICKICSYKHMYELEPHGHNFSGEWTIDKEATCSENGYKSHHCIICDATTDRTTISATGHDYGALEYAVTPSCTGEGTIYQKCQNCDNEREFVAPALGHNYSNSWTIDVMPTCTEAGSMSRKCSRCDSVTDVTEILPLGHDYSKDYTIDVKPTCTESGEQSQHCNNCGDRINISTVEPLGHDFDTRWTIDVEPTCTEDGEKSHRCLNCRERTDVTIMGATGHSYSDWIIASEATCFEAGLRYQECENCKEKNYEEIPAGNHVYGGWTVVTNATCDIEGLKTRVCSLCEAEDSSVIEPLGHYYSTNWTVDVESSCTEDGSMSHHCIRCEDKKDVTVLPATDHCFGAWLVDKEATCDEAGTLYRECEICETRETKETEANGHFFSTAWTIDVAPTCTEKGIKSHHCFNCDATKDATRISATGHIYGAWIFDVEATCETEGSRHKVCENCDDTVTQSVLPMGHHYSTMWTIDVDPTCLTKGEKSHHCLRCDDKQDIEEIPYGGHIFGKWYVVTEPTMDTDGVRAHKCYNCEFTEELAIPKLHKYTATFVADGDVVATVDFPEDATEIEIPEVPFKDKYSGEWENFEVRNKDFTVNAIYTPVSTDNMDGIDASNKTDYFESTGEIEVNLHAAAQEKTIITTTTKPVPLDIVLVLDQSGSMADGNKTGALKNAVTSFSNTVLGDAISKNVDHRIAIVGFASGGNDNLNYENTELLTADVIKYNKIKDSDYANTLVSVNDNGEINNIISKAIKEIDAKGATKADLGLEMASNIFANNAISGNRQRVVVFLTDGEPTSYSNFEYSVANAAIQNAYQIKNTYDANIYSVGIFDRATASNANVNNFMNYVSSNYNEEKVLSKKKAETTPAASGYYLDVSDVSKLSEIFTSIVEEAIIHTGEFDNVTLKYTLTKNFTLTSVQEEVLRKDAVEKLGVTNEQITITRNDDGTTTIIIESVSPWLQDGEYVVDFTFRATANENTLKSGTYQSSTYDSGLILEDGEGYEAVFTPDTVDVKGTSGIVTFNINKVPYFIERLSSTSRVLAPDVDFGLDHEFSGWNIPSNLTLNNECRTFEASLDRNEYIVSWNINGEMLEHTYEVGSIITPPEVKGDSICGMFAGWDKTVPETMPSENLTFTAVYEAHYHNYTITKEFESCDLGGMLTYTCECGETYTEEIAPCEHTWEAITGATGNNEQHSVGFRCSVCGVQNENDLELERIDTYQEGDASNTTATYEFNYVDENGEKQQPDGEVEISVQLDEVFEEDIPDDANANVYRVNDDGSRTLLESEQDGMNMTFTTDHFSTYEFEFTTGEQKYLFAQKGSEIDYTNKLIFSNKYLAKEFKSIVTYLIPATIKVNTDESGYFGTGTSIDLSKDNTTDNYTVIVNGDLNGDGVCDVIDAATAQLYSAGFYEPTENEIYAANGCVSDEIDILSYQNVVNTCLAS